MIDFSPEAGCVTPAEQGHPWWSLARSPLGCGGLAEPGASKAPDDLVREIPTLGEVPPLLPGAGGHADGAHANATQ
jgi:hypothetical protein